MKALIILRENNIKSLNPLFPGGHPAMAPICNKPLLEYFVDFIVLSRCDSLIINMEKPSTEVQSHFGNGDRWGICISYNIIKPEERIDSIIDSNDIYMYCNSFPLIILDGLFFIHYDKSDFRGRWNKSLDAGLFTSCDTGSLLIAPNDQNLRNISSTNTGIPFALSKLETLDDYFRLTMEILDAEQKHYVLPAYKETRKILFGKNVKIGLNSDIRPPAIIGNNVRLLDNVTVGPHTVIGHNVIIDEKCEVQKSIVQSNTYIGAGLQLSRKIIDGGRVIGLPDGVVLKIDDKALFSHLPPVSNFSLKKMFTQLISFFRTCCNYLPGINSGGYRRLF